MDKNKKEPIRAMSYFKVMHDLLQRTEVTDSNGKSLLLDEGAAKAVDIIVESRAKEEVVVLIGNGGSAAIASHMQTDLSNSVGIRAIVFNDPSQLTALSNDHGYPHAFEKALLVWAKFGNVLIAISSSGQSENILRAVRTARAKGMKVITFSGFESGNPLRGMGSLNFYVDSYHYGFVELAHSCLAHFITDTIPVNVSVHAPTPRPGSRIRPTEKSYTLG